MLGTSVLRSATASYASSRLRVLRTTVTYAKRLATTQTTSSVPAHAPQSSPAAQSTNKEPLNVLTRLLRDTIRIKGPLSVADYIRIALTHPAGGYYIRRNPFGHQGDFTTAPELSSLFGEMVALWLVTQWQPLLAANPNLTVRLVELGPGRGTLMTDVLRTLRALPRRTIPALDTINMVEASRRLQEIQAHSLGRESINTPTDNTTTNNSSKESMDPLDFITEDGTKVCFHTALGEVPRDMPTFIIANEFFDAMPVYKFEKTKEGWREIMVIEDDTNEHPEHFRFSLAPYKSKAAYVILQDDTKGNEYEVGEKIEISPEGYAVAHEIAKFIEECSGAALIADYGRNYPLEDSVRAISSHKFVSILSNPGDYDISADVDFSLLAKACEGHAHAHGPITQSTFLRAMGIVPRIQTMLPTMSREEREKIALTLDRLISPKQMGLAYKFFVISSNKETPYPFSTDPLINEEEDIEGRLERRRNVKKEKQQTQETEAHATSTVDSDKP